MRILVAFNQHRGHGGGGARAAFDSVALLREYSHEVELFTKSSDELPKNLWGRLQAAGSIIAAPGSVREFTSLVDRFRPDVVHVYELFPLVSPWILPVCGARRIAVVLTPIDYRLTCPVVTHLYKRQICTRCCGGREYWAILRNCRNNMAESISVAAYNTIVRVRAVFHNHVTHYAVCSEFTRQFLIERLALSPECISVHCPLVELGARPVDDPSGGSYFGFAGRFTEEKGVHVVLDAARRSGLPVRLARNVHSRAEVAVPPELEVVTQGREDLVEFYQNARAIIVPSIWFETFGFVAAETMCLGLPVIVSRLGALATLVVDGVDGLHFAPGDAADLARKMELIWNHPNLCLRLGQAAQQRSAEWSKVNVYHRQIEIYGKAICDVQKNNESGG